MPQLSNIQRELIITIKKDHPTWGHKKITEFLPSLYAVTKNQFDQLFAVKKSEITPVAKKEKKHREEGFTLWKVP